MCYEFILYHILLCMYYMYVNDSMTRECNILENLQSMQYIHDIKTHPTKESKYRKTRTKISCELKMIIIENVWFSMY